MVAAVARRRTEFAQGLIATRFARLAAPERSHTWTAYAGARHYARIQISDGGLRAAADRRRRVSPPFGHSGGGSPLGTSLSFPRASTEPPNLPPVHEDCFIITSLIIGEPA